MSPRLVTRAMASAVVLAMATTTTVLTGGTRQTPTASSRDPSGEVVRIRSRSLALLTHRMPPALSSLSHDARSDQ